ncbi:MAG: flagellar protein FlaI [Natronomonas sp.]|jgi:flagellar protein FlaI|uniref:type II/IV secretion system ATPase subunit n=1 Tax=Natronomonas sp. TaxID=2184060 RepID=UPI003988BE30
MSNPDESGSEPADDVLETGTEAAGAFGPPGGSADAVDSQTPSTESITELDHPNEAVIPDLLAYFDTAPMPELAPAPEPEFLRDQFFSFDYLNDGVATDRYWVNEPYAFVTILYDRTEDDYRYRVVEPILDEFEQFLRHDLEDLLRNVLLYEPASDTTDAEMQQVFFERAVELINEYAHDIDPGSLYKVQYYLQRDFLGFDLIDPLMRDRRIEDVSCDGPEVPIYVYHREHRDLETNVSFPKESLNSFITSMAQRAGKHISVVNPMVDGSLVDGSRIQLTLGEEVSTRGSNFTIRRFADVPITPVDLVAWDTFSPEIMAYLWLTLENNMSLLFAGGTASGKTTSLNASSLFIPRKSKVVTIEDTREITLPHDNWIQSVTRESYANDQRGDIGMYKLLQSALRQRPEYLVVGEIRTEANVALTFFQAMATGHTACTTFHADSVETILSRLQNPPLEVPEQMIQELDIVCVQRQTYRENTRVRRNVGVTEIVRGADGLERNQLFQWRPESDTFDRTGESVKLEEIKQTRAWSDERLREELDRRERFLRGLVNHGIREYGAVSDAIRLFQQRPVETLSDVEAGDLDSDSPPGPGPGPAPGSVPGEADE